MKESLTKQIRKLATGVLVGCAKSLRRVNVVMEFANNFRRVRVAMGFAKSFQRVNVAMGFAKSFRRVNVVMGFAKSFQRACVAMGFSKSFRRACVAMGFANNLRRVRVAMGFAKSFRRVNVAMGFAKSFQRVNVAMEFANNFRRVRVGILPTRVGLWFINSLLVGLLLIGTPATGGDIYNHIVTRSQWPQHANGQNIPALPAVKEALRRFEENGKVTIVILYPGGDPGRQWANQLYGWLVSLGIPTRYIELQPGSGATDRLVVSVINRG